MSDEELSDVPRRLRRFYRNNQMPLQNDAVQPAEPEGNVLERKQDSIKKQSSEIAARELQRFRQKFRRLPKQEEFDEVAEKVYTQVKTDALKQEQVHRKFRPKKDQVSQAEIQKSAEAIKAKGIQQKPALPESKDSKTSIAELLQEGARQESGKKDKFSIEDLNIDSEDLKNSLDNLSEGDDSEDFLTQVQSEKNNCPNCGEKTDHLIFCPNCGAAFCTHCVKQAKDLGDKISYTCPKCGSEFTAKKT